MPEWNLADLYSSPTAPEIARDLDAAAAEARRIKEAYHGKLVGLAADGAVLALAIEEFERFVELMGTARLLRRALLRRQPGRSRARQVLRRHLREAHRHLHRHHLLRAGAQPDRRSGDGAGAEEPAPCPLQAVDRQRPQGEALPARGEARAAVPREGPDLGRRLQPAVQRDDDGAALPRRRRARAAGARDDAQPAVQPRREEAPAPRPKRSPRCSRTTCACSR